MIHVILTFAIAFSTITVIMVGTRLKETYMKVYGVDFVLIFVTAVLWGVYSYLLTTV